jgi:hypothetical protein
MQNELIFTLSDNNYNTHDSKSGRQDANEKGNTNNRYSNSTKKIKNVTSDNKNDDKHFNKSKNFLYKVNEPKPSLKSIRVNLSDALHNINRELNVKIEKKDIERIKMPLLDYFCNNDDFAPAKQKIDIENVIENLNNYVKKQSLVEEGIMELNKEEFGNYKSEETEISNNGDRKLFDNDNSNYGGIHVRKLQNTNTLSNECKEQIHNRLIFDEGSLNKNEEEVFKNLVSNNIIERGIISNEYSLSIEKLIAMLILKSDENTEKTNGLQRLEIENLKLKEEISLANTNLRSTETEKDKLNIEYMRKLREMENMSKSNIQYIQRLEKENIILKNELVNKTKSRNTILRIINQEVKEMKTISKDFIEGLIPSDNIEELNSIEKEE